MTKPQLLASGPSLQSLAKAIVQFYCGTSIDLIPDGEAWSVQRVSDGKMIKGVRVIWKANRYRFEAVVHD